MIYLTVYVPGISVQTPGSSFSGSPTGCKGSAAGISRLRGGRVCFRVIRVVAMVAGRTQFLTTGGLSAPDPR